ncbi:Asp-tRNA(Asn)/Glu-tRNA(Gln) amidotransferase subunit GatB [Lacihabitans soyangensis]|uniref:Aspartyl/glutamyl-tRNA(Asn/Gln) amidotransferase subunit B n=1 Tax=Lacihabitans soyangensis TaxID=869394 RepID=A0AAE3H1G6_9BACT|nr:Asp-tRNA(Asn)/Glu-tRNA(Gln) amidotransferase subunit GatB [Lacihabitans soyangensis]MCP9763038.1 Asp-tRNA(Asn)/Glu-tRNA(Gln) amidotransferase subunit GatB [Lacihabitans soyangensis]
MEYDIVIGLEVHCQLETESKIFASDSNKFGGEPNTHIGVITLAHPGVLPKLNEKAVEFAIKLGLAFDCEINQFNFFDRKNYFYPDLPKGYQISQDKSPICWGGEVKFKIKKGKDFSNHAVKIHHIHMEEDAGKSIHDIEPNNTCLDYNRAGTPLLEIVSEPCMTSPIEAAGYLAEIRKMVRFLGISDGNMEEGSLRADLNVSLKPKGSEKLGTKVEIKNMNSIRFLQKAAEYEIERQSAILDAGGTIIQETRSFDPEQGKTFGMRVKETMNDYRYFPEPDLAPIIISDEELKLAKSRMPKLPYELFETFSKEMGILEEHAYLLTEEKSLSDYFLETCNITKNYKSVSNWMLSNIKGYLNENNLEIGQFPVKPVKLAELIKNIDEGNISNSAAQVLMGLLIAGPESDILELAKSNNLIQSQDSDSMGAWIEEVLAQNAPKVEEYKKGKKGLMGFFVGEVMKKSKGSADPKVLNTLLAEKLT